MGWGRLLLLYSALDVAGKIQLWVVYFFAQD